jgi:outer membrane protein OmpA-like peptidoglycan-associated protein
VLAASACASPSRPPVMARVAEVRTSPASVESETWAPQAHALAVGLEERAERALADGDTDTAALLAEHAMAAHEHAWVLTRLARAERRRLDAEAELAEQRRVLGELQAQQQRLSAEAAGLELRSQVAKGTRALPSREGATERQETQRRASTALATQARLLCVGARMLGEVQRAPALIARLDELDRQLAAVPASKGVDDAAALRAECSRLISEVRRENSAPAARAPGERSGVSQKPNVAGKPVAVAPLPADALLDELSSSGAAPSRDDRGVSVSLRDVLGAQGQLNETARTQLRNLGQVAKAHPDFPVLIVGHSASPEGDAVMGKELEAVRSELTGVGVASIEVQAVSDRQPLLSPRSPAARERNQRIELVFVAPGF